MSLGTRRPLASLGLAASLLVGGGLIAAGCTAAPRYVGPRSAHFDGKRFYNLGVCPATLAPCPAPPPPRAQERRVPYEERGLSQLLRWKLSGPRATPWPRFVATPPSPPPPARVGDGVRVTFVNHATVLIQMNGVNILTDPVWSGSVGPTAALGQRRHKPVGIPFSSLPPIDVVLISHNHYDHLDLPTLRQLHQRDQPLVLAGLGTAQLLRKHGVARAADLDWWQSQEVRGVRVTFTPAQHWSTRSAVDRDLNLWGSYYLSAGDRTVYFAGDTGAGPHFQMIHDRLGPPQLALIPIGAYAPRWFMRPQHIDPTEAVAAHLTLGARRSVAIHWGTFRQADEGMDDPVAELDRALRAAGIPATDFVALDNGQSLTLP